MRHPLLLALALCATVATAQEVFIAPSAPTQWDFPIVAISDKVETDCLGKFTLELTGVRTLKAYFIPDRAQNDPTCKHELLPIVVSGTFYSNPAGDWKLEYYRPYALAPSVTKTFTVDATSITQANPFEVIPAAPTSADVIRVRFRVYDSICENLDGFTEGVELPSGNVNLRFIYPTITQLCPPPPRPWEYSISPRDPGAYVVSIVDHQSGSTGHAQKTITVGNSTSDTLPNVRDGAVNMSDLWQPRGESGWGVTINQHGPAPARILAVMYWFGELGPNRLGFPRWYAVTGGTWVRKNVLSGTIYRTLGSAVDAAQQLAASTTNIEAGTALLEFLSPTTMKLHVNWKAGSGVYPTFVLDPQPSFLRTLDRLPF